MGIGLLLVYLFDSIHGAIFYSLELILSPILGEGSVFLK